MNNRTILNKVKELLGMEVKLEQRKLEDGVTVIEADEFAPDNEVMIVTEDEQMIPLPVGEYVMEGGEEVLVVTEEGLISEIKAKEEEMADESRPIKKTVESIVKETFFTEIENLKKENAELKAKLETLSSDENTNEETTNEEVTNETEVVEEVAEVELSSEEPAAKPISYNPENKENTEKFNFAKNRPRNIMDTVLKRINK